MEFLRTLFTLYCVIGLPVYLLLLGKLLKRRDFGGAALSLLMAGLVIGLWPAFLNFVKSEA